jgi:hypothetical protein
MQMAAGNQAQVASSRRPIRKVLASGARICATDWSD